MSDDIGTLLAIAEIAGVFVGFAALVGFVARRSDRESGGVGTFGLVNVVLVSVVVVVGALVPVALSRYGLPESTVCRASGGLLFVLNWVQILYVGRITRGFRSAHFQSPGFSTAVWSLEPLYQISLLLCVAGVWPLLSPAFYLTALIVALAQVSLIFANLVATLVTSS